MDTMAWAVLAAVAVALAGGGYYLLTRRRGQRHERREAFLHFRCPGCKRRLRFRAAQAGHRGECSNCGKALTFPRADQAID